MAKKDKDDLSVGNIHGKRTRIEPDNKLVSHHGSTTQGGSDFGQGSSYLGSESYKQGSEGNSGSNYENERWISDDVNNEPPPQPAND